MEVTVQQQQQQPTVHSADVVGNAFVHQYYHILHQSPQLVHRFYQDRSKLGRPGEDGFMTTTTTMNDINEKILSIGCGGNMAEILTVDSQDSHCGGVLVLVTGYIYGTDNVRLKFTQSFFLAPQDKGYFVLNDVFRYVDETKHQIEDQGLVNNVEAPPAPVHEPSSVQENGVTEPINELSEEVNEEEVYNPPESGDGSVEDEEAPVPEVVDAVPDDSQIVPESNTKIVEAPKMTYASIVKVLKENNAPFTTPAPPQRHVPKIQEPVTNPAPPFQEMHVASTNATENEIIQDNEVDGPSIYVKGLPSDATHALLENEFKKFGPIRPGGIQVRFQKGFCYGFVEFEAASAVQSAIEASPIVINGCRVVVEEKRSTSRGNNRGRFSSGGPGHRNEGPRGRGNYGGGKGYGRGDFGNRGEFGGRGGGRGGFSRGEGYRRAEKMGSNGARGNRAGGMNFNGAPKTAAPRVSATA